MEQRIGQIAHSVSSSNRVAMGGGSLKRKRYSANKTRCNDLIRMCRRRKHRWPDNFLVANEALVLPDSIESTVATAN